MSKRADKDKKRDRVTYYLDEPVREYIRQLSIEWGVPASQVAKYFLIHAIDAHKSGSIAPPSLVPSDSPAYRNVINFQD